jgi:MSHA biogenesis protein MshK
MDEIMSAFQARKHGAASVLCAAMMPALLMACMLAWPARAQNMVDPTQPPPEARMAANGAEAAAPVRSGPQLQSVLIGTRGREVAVIDGQTLRKGDKFNGAVLVRISKNEVVLQHGRERQRLTLFPDAGAGAGAEPKASAHTRAPTQ